MSIARVNGEPAEFVWRGTTYKIAPITYEIQGLFVRFMEKRAWEMWERSKATLSAADARENMALVSRDIAAGVYAWDTELARNFTMQPDGFTHLVWLCIKKHHPEFSEQDARAMATESAEQISAVMGELNRPTNPPHAGEEKDAA